MGPCKLFSLLSTKGKLAFCPATTLSSPEPLVKLPSLSAPRPPHTEHAEHHIVNHNHIISFCYVYHGEQKKGTRAKNKHKELCNRRV